MTPKQFADMQARLGRERRKPGSVFADAGPVRVAPARQVILGIDPSLRATGFGVIEAAGSAARMLGHGTVRCPGNWLPSRCLVRIAEEIRAVIRQYHPTVCAVEGLFYAQNFQTALIMGEARGVALCTAAEAGLEIYEIAARKVKQAIVGYGGAQKLAVARMVQRLLRLEETPAPDAADALALSLAHAHEHGRFRLNPAKRI